MWIASHRVIFILHNISTTTGAYSSFSSLSVPSPSRSIFCATSFLDLTLPILDMGFLKWTDFLTFVVSWSHSIGLNACDAFPLFVVFVLDLTFVFNLSSFELMISTSKLRRSSNNCMNWYSSSWMLRLLKPPFGLVASESFKGTISPLTLRLK